MADDSKRRKEKGARSKDVLQLGGSVIELGRCFLDLRLEGSDFALEVCLQFGRSRS